ncbi:MAG: ATP-binding protein [Clostridia bacterium]|nr:ATP-binding protein [Clostridia bacterium]
MKKNKKNGTAGELRLVNRISGNLHGGVSRIRLSLTFRIAAHYCLQMIRSLLPACLLVTVLFCTVTGIVFSTRLGEMTASEPAVTEEYTPVHFVIVREEGLSGEAADTGFFAQGARIVSSFLRDTEVTFLYAAEGDTLYSVHAEQKALLLYWAVLLAGVLLADLYREGYFFRHNTRLNRRVLKPIREITELAATLSENNLSNRINLAGTKNELKDLAGVINDMLDRIELSYNSQKQFVSDASHELRTPIAVIRGYTDMLKRWGKDDPEVLTEAITAISQETEGMKDLAESLLFLARHDKKTLMMEKTVFRPGELLAEVCREAELVTPGTQFMFSQTSADPELYADRGMIKQVLRILCDNAVKYSPAGSTVTLRLAADEKYCRLSVADQGPGIPPEDIARIFERFYRGDKARHSETGGHGLGLSIARIIVVAHEGKIKVRSKAGEGTEFTVEVPLGKAS